MQIVFRADASQKIGTGHVMRCLALAQAWQENGGEASIFAMAMKTPSVESRLLSEGQQVVDVSAHAGSAEDAAQTTAIARRRKDSCLVVDGYCFGAEYQQIIRDAGLRSMVVDDFGRSGPYQSDFLLNQNLYACEALYAGLAPRARLLLGPRYALLRREFWPLRSWRRKVNSTGNRVLVTFGGTDPDNVTLKVIHALQQIQIDSLETVVVIGGSNGHYAELKKAIIDSPIAIRLEHDATNMPELMAWADLAVSAGGSTCWEVAFTGLPCLVIALDAPQLIVARELESRGVAMNVGLHESASAAKIGACIKQLLCSPEDRVRMSMRGQELIDGKGVDRVVGALALSELRLRRASGADCVQLWKWVNDQAVRASAFHSGEISWDEHRRWFSSKLNDPQCVQFIAMDGQGVPIGQIRFDIHGGEAEVDLSIDKEKRGLGYGAALIQMGIRELGRTIPVKAVHAFIKPDNEASEKSFLGAAFKVQGIEEIKGIRSLHLKTEVEAAAAYAGEALP